MNDKRVVYTNAEGGVCIIVPAPGVSQEDVLKAVPPGAVYEIVDAADIPADRTFRDAWEKSNNGVAPNIDKAKTIAHDMRRAKRSTEFAPLDVEATIPARAAQAEEARQVIRDKYAAIQSEIDECPDCEALKTVVDREGL